MSAKTGSAAVEPHAALALEAGAVRLVEARLVDEPDLRACAQMSFSAPAMSKACWRLSIWQGPAIKASGRSLPKIAWPTFTWALGAMVIRLPDAELRQRPSIVRASTRRLSPHAHSEHVVEAPVVRPARVDLVADVLVADVGRECLCWVIVGQVSERRCLRQSAASAAPAAGPLSSATPPARRTGIDVLAVRSCGSAIQNFSGRR